VSLAQNKDLGVDVSVSTLRAEFRATQGPIQQESGFLGGALGSSMSGVSTERKASRNRSTLRVS
jgi:hypothetical protein